MRHKGLPFQEKTIAAYSGAGATCRRTVLTAFQDVEHQLAAQHFLAGQLGEETLAVASSQRALDIANKRYKSGGELYLDVITAQITELAYEQSVIQLLGQRITTSVALIKSLGDLGIKTSDFRARCS